VRHRAKPRANGEPQPDRHIATRLFADELAEVDRRAASAGLSRFAFLRAALLANGDTCAVLRATIAERDERIARLEEEAKERQRCLTIRLAGLESQLESARLQYARDVAGWERSDVAERRRQAQSLFYG
jgi:hypothetical protein